MNLISALIPSFNHEKYVRYTIESLAAQSYQNLEVIIIDDGSTDGTWQELLTLKSEFESRFVRFVIEKQERRGTALTLKRQVDLAQGLYVYVIASDDVAKTSALQLLADFLDNNILYCAVLGDGEYIDDQSNVFYLDNEYKRVYKKEEAALKTVGDFLQSRRPEVRFSSEDFGTYSSLVCGNYIPNGYLIRRQSILDARGYEDEAPLEDWFLMLQLSKYSKIKFLPQVLFEYRKHHSNVSGSNRWMRVAARKTLEIEINRLRRTQDKRHESLFMESLDSVSRPLFSVSRFGLGARVTINAIELKIEVLILQRKVIFAISRRWLFS